MDAEQILSDHAQEKLELVEGVFLRRFAGYDFSQPRINNHVQVSALWQLHFLHISREQFFAKYPVWLSEEPEGQLLCVARIGGLVKYQRSQHAEPAALQRH